jgi:hypothetical protein
LKRLVRKIPGGNVENRGALLFTAMLKRERKEKKKFSRKGSKKKKINMTTFEDSKYYWILR